MKFIKRIAIVTIAWLGVSCDATELDLTVDPNNPNEDQAQLDLLYNSVVENFLGAYEAAHFFGDGPARMVAFTASTYREGVTPGSLNGLWNNAYSGLLPDLDAVIERAEPKGRYFHIGTGKIMKAYTMLALVDLLGDVPYSEVGLGSDNLSPQRDTGPAVYAAVEALLDEAITDLAQSPTEDTELPEFDIFYDKDPAQWIKLANTLKLKIYVNTAAVDASAVGKFMAIINSGAANFISDPDGLDDFQFQYGTERNNPNSRHPFYNNSYENADGTYMSTYYVWLLYSEKRMTDALRTPYASGTNDQGVDPRIRFYFYRQESSLENKNPAIWSCVFSQTPFLNNNDGAQVSAPSHYLSADPDMPYCMVDPNGYYTRDHGNGEGIPPDGAFRVVYGLYPGGGLFDDGSAESTQNGGTDGALGAGIDPILLASFVDFWRAEMALTYNTGENAKDMMMAGVNKSLAKVRSFSSLSDLDGTGFLSDATLDANEAAYTTAVAEIYDNAGAYANGITTDELDVVMKEFLIAAWGNGYEAYNNIRRTGRPLNHQPMLDTAPGSFVYSCFYPSNHVNFNPNATQKDGLETKVFWDTNGDIVR